MIHGAKVEVTCDNSDCRESVYVDLHYVYRDRCGASGHYDDKPETIEKSLRSEHDWVVVDGQQFCSNDCAWYSREGRVKI